MATPNELYKEGVRLKDAKDYAAAEAKLLEALAADEKLTLALHALVQTYTEQGKHQEAITTAIKIVELEPNDFFAYIALSRAYQRAGMIPEAEYAMMQGQQAQMRAQAAR